MTIRTGWIAAVIALPAPWPPRTPCTLQRARLNDCDAELVGIDDGRLLLRVVQDATAEATFFQRVLLSEPGYLLIVMSWSEAGHDVHINGQPLERDPVGNGPCLYVDTTQGPKPGFAVPVYATVNPAEFEDGPARFFIETLRDIDQKVIERRPYSLIRAAGLLRQLLLDEHPLVDTVNQKLRLRIRYTIMTSDDTPEQILPGLEVHWKNINSEWFPRSPTVEVDRDRLLSTVILRLGQSGATVRDIIRVCANAKGGVHMGSGRGDRENIALAFDSGYAYLGEEPSLAALAGICRVVLRGLAPLVTALRGNGPTQV
jgi:hypothetical protein